MWFSATCFLWDWAGRVSAGGECYGSAKSRTLWKCRVLHSEPILHTQFILCSQVWFYLTLQEALSKQKWLTGVPPLSCFPALRIHPTTNQWRGNQNQTLLAWRMKGRFTRVCWKVEISHSRGWVASSDLLALLPQKVGDQGTNLFILHSVKRQVITVRTAARLIVLKQVEVSLSSLFAIPSFPSIFVLDQTGQKFRDPFIWSRFLFPRETSLLHPAHQPHPVPSCSSSRLLRLALLSICSHYLAMLELFLLWYLSGPHHFCWPGYLDVAGTVCSTASCLPGVCGECMGHCEPAMPCRFWNREAAGTAASLPLSFPHHGLSRLGQGRAWFLSGSCMGEYIVSQLQPKNGFRWGEDWGKNALAFWTALPKNSTSYQKGLSLSPSFSCFQHYVRPVGLGVKLGLNKKNLFKQLLFPKRQLNLNGDFDIQV